MSSSSASTATTPTRATSIGAGGSKSPGPSLTTPTTPLGQRSLRRRVAPTLRALCIMCAVTYSLNWMQSMKALTTSLANDSWAASLLMDLSFDPPTEDTKRPKDMIRKLPKKKDTKKKKNIEPSKTASKSIKNQQNEGEQGTVAAVETGIKTATIESSDPAALTSINVVSNGASTDRYAISTPEFVKHPGVVIVTKVHGPPQFGMLEQSLCLLHYAYNHRVLYDIIVFTTEEIPMDQVQALQNLTEPANLTVVIDNDGLHNEIEKLPKHKHDYFLERCNVTTSEGLDWYSTCMGAEAHHQERLGYNWQAEFRSLHIWHHPAIASYRYMMWYDADSFATKPWERDPVAFAIEKQSAILFDHFPMGKAKNWIQKRIMDAFGARLCKAALSEENGSMITETRSDGRCGERGIPNIHGFFHITDMTFYRSPEVQNAIETLMGHCFLCRFPDDQLSVTAPAIMMAPNRTFDMRLTMGTNLDVFHNGKLDGLDKTTPPGFKGYWRDVASKALPEADGVCPIIAFQ